jgi:hypothetical protein
MAPQRYGSAVARMAGRSVIGRIQVASCRRPSVRPPRSAAKSQDLRPGQMPFYRVYELDEKGHEAPDSGASGLYENATAKMVSHT